MRAIPFSRNWQLPIAEHLLPIAFFFLLGLSAWLAVVWPCDNLFTKQPPPAHPVIQVAADATEADKTARSQKLPEKISFNAHIRPIMSNTCFSCHGPDEEAHESELRLYSFAAAVDEGEAIEPGNAEESLVYLRLMDADDPMPPADFRHQLSDYEKALFRKWIEQGAEYESHWSYTPIKRPDVPEVSGLEKNANPVDAFVQTRLSIEGFEPAPEADKATLLRRLSLDLIGIPPTPEELDSFLADSGADAYEMQVERLLASPHYGERMAAQWLDIVRFSDTVGFHGDQNQNVFSYRDYVIDSINKNKPFDQFTREQLAGDLLENPTDEQLIGTSLIRLNMMTREGGAQPREYLAKYTADRVRMIGTAFLGATTGCCECHNHKYDPLTAKDFYSLGAFFDDVRQWGVYSDYDYSPNPDLKGYNNDAPFPPELRSFSKSLLAQIEFLESALAKQIVNTTDASVFDRPEFKQWAAALADDLESHTDGWTPVEIIKAESSKKTQLKKLDDGSLLVVDESQAEDSLTVTTEFPNSRTIKSIRLEVIPDGHHDGYIGRARDGRFSTTFAASIDRRRPPDEAVEEKPKLVRPRFVRVELDRAEFLALAEVEVFVEDEAGIETNIATKGTATQSSTYPGGDAKLAIDGNTDGDFNKSKSVSHTSNEGNKQWWELDLGSEQALTNIVIWNRTDGNVAGRLKGYQVVLLNNDHQPIVSLEPDFPSPSIKIAVPTDRNIDTSLGSINIEFGQADRERPAKYSNGHPPLFLSELWESGPSRWQLPIDEAKQKHTAVYHLQTSLHVDPQDHLIFTLDSADIGRFKISVSPLTRFVAGLPVADRSLADAVKAHQAGAEILSEQRQSLIAAFYLSTNGANKLPADVLRYRDAILRCRSGQAMTTVAQQAAKDKIRPSRILPRGDWQNESGEKVVPATPEFLPQLPEAETRRLTRLDLANWITSQNNPLPARHYVNRTWKHFFGTGLSNRLDDLGNQGEWPSHPLLLDWLSDEFRQAWDMKLITRLIVTSNTYKQQVTLHSRVMEFDPYNRLLSQQSPRRLEAESVRDNALAIAGLLNDNFVGGPSFFPYQPAGHYSNLQFPNRGYKASPDQLQYRRGVYMHWQRTFLHPMLVNFDAPSRDECVADRTPSNSPQQALTLLNDPQFVEASNAFAADLLSNAALTVFDMRLDAAFKRAMARVPTNVERDGLLEFYERQKKHYSENKSEIDDLLDKNGNFKRVNSLDRVELAAWSQVCRVILNLHETITRY